MRYPPRTLEKTSGFFLNQSFVSGLRTLGKFNMPFDLLVEADQLDDVLKLVKLAPGVTFNLNHLGYPQISNNSKASFDTWADRISNLAQQKNVHCKLSGLPQCTGGTNWTASDFEPFVRHILDVFPPSRINYAGNWFILNKYGDYESMWRAVQQVMDDLKVSPESRALIFGKAAKMLYNLSV